MTAPPRLVPAPAPAASYLHRDDLARTLGDVRELLRHLPTEHRNNSIWRYVAGELEKAAAGGDVADAAIALRLALMLEKVECRPK